MYFVFKLAWNESCILLLLSFKNLEIPVEIFCEFLKIVLSCIKIQIQNFKKVYILSFNPNVTITAYNINSEFNIK